MEKETSEIREMQELTRELTSDEIEDVSGAGIVGELNEFVQIVWWNLNCTGNNTGKCC
jgi:hypothetical protein